MSDFSWALRQTIYSMLTTPGITDVTTVSNIPLTEPTNSDFPFIIIGEGQLLPDDATATSGSDGGVVETIDLHVWSRTRSQKQTLEIASTIYDRFHGQSLTVSSRASALCWVRDRRIFPDPDGLTRHGVVTLEITHRS